MPAEKSLIPTSVNPDIQKERDGATFDVKEFLNWWFDGEQNLKEKREIETLLLKDLKERHELDYLSHEELYNTTVRELVDVARTLRKLQQERNPGGSDIWPKALFGLNSHALFPHQTPFATHATMFVDVIMNQGTPEQVEKFGKPAQNCNIIGTYAQTELAHGTNVRGIETRADYDRKTDEFVLNTPTLHAYKWWPGGLGHTANHAMVVAQLYIDGQHKGIQMFIVPLRDGETHLPLPGVDIGEIGKKMGMHAVNQGYLGLKNVRIPRTNMLMKNAKVLPDGTFVQSPASKISYMTMVYTRCLIVSQNATFLSEAATIATRYSAVRRQSPINPNEPEPQIMDHMTQKQKLFPEIATAVAYSLASKELWKLYNQTLAETEQGEYAGLPEVHVLSCAMKVLCTTDSCVGIERLRLSCGGHGYLTSSNLSHIYGNAVAASTYEGENTVLLLQVGRYLVKAWQSLLEGKRLATSVSYLERVHRRSGPPTWTGTWPSMVDALQYAAAQKTRLAFESLAARIKSGQTLQEASNNTGIELIQAAELHGRQFVVATLVQQISGPKMANYSAELKAVLQNLVELYLVHTSINQLSNLLAFVPLRDYELSALQNRLERALNIMRPDAVAICDGFDFHDRVLNSVLGCYDGNVYERMFEAAKRSPLNQKPVPDSFQQYLKPFMKSNL